MAFGDRLRNLLEERKLTQKYVAADLNIAASTFGSYVQNSREPDYELLKRIAIYFDVSVDYLLEHKCPAASGYEGELIRIFRTLDTNLQELYVEQGRVFAAYCVKARNYE